MCDQTEAQAWRDGDLLPGTSCYYWGGKDFRVGTPRLYPAYLQWNQAQWENWIQTTLATPPLPPPAAPTSPLPQQAPPPPQRAPPVRPARTPPPLPTGRQRSPSATTKILLNMFRQPPT